MKIVILCSRVYVGILLTVLQQTQGLLVKQTTEANSYKEANTQTHFRVFARLLEVCEYFILIITDTAALCAYLCDHVIVR